jgi:hypothetical protein
MITVAKTSTSNLTPLVNGYDLKSLSVFHQSKPVAISLRKSKSVQKQKVLPRFEIEFFEFNHKFSFEIIEIEGELPSSEIVLYLKFDNNVIRVVLSGKWKDDEGLYINNFGLGIEKTGETPVSAFLLKTLWVMLGLSTKVKIQIPTFNQEATMSFDTSLNTISDLLQTRQIAYRLMIIEKAFGVKLPFPQFIDGKDIENIAYCYHSVVDKKFEWFCQSAITPWVASQTYFSLLPEKNVPFPIQYGYEPIEKEIFGYQIDLGLQTGKIEEAVLDNFEEVKKELSKLDGSQVLAQVRSKSGIVQIESITTPHLPEKVFSKDIQQLIDLEDKFDSMYFDKYLNSFSNAFEGLTDEQVQAITERPTLEEEAFNF